MSTERWPRVKDLFQQALDQPPARRHAWLQDATPDDPELRREVQTLLQAYDTDFLKPLPPVRTPEHLQPGTRLGPYEILRELGRGGAGVVYLAHNHTLGNNVALKMATTTTPDQRERLIREARAAATIAHPAVATVHALEEFDGQLVIVSEYVDGRMLRAILADGPLPRAQVVDIAMQIARALQAAHDAGVVHRDLKPENILVSAAGQVKVVDFGIARLGGAPHLTGDGTLLGTPAYMAPEQLVGARVDARADIYSFGIVLSEMLTGRHPGLAASASPAHPPDDALLRIARECTQLDPAARYQTAAMVIAALERMQNGMSDGRTRARWWWEFHQAAVAAVYWLALWPSWQARAAIGGSPGRVFFALVLAAVVTSSSLRLHFWFTSRSYPDELSWVRRRSSRWIAAADTLFSLGLIAGAFLTRGADSSIDVVLLSIGIGAAIAFLVIEAATTRAAFK